MQKPEIKILTGFRLSPKMKEDARRAAAMERRSISNYIENLIWKDLVAKKIRTDEISLV